MKLDELESVFRSAVKTRFHVHPPRVETGLLITDLGPEPSRGLADQLRAFLDPIHGESVEWSVLARDDYDEVADVLDRVRRNPPGMVACYRHLLVAGAKLPYSLGPTVDTLTQATDVPILLLPRPDDQERLNLPARPARVMVVTDHLVGDETLINWAIHMTSDDGTVLLGHVEDELTFRRYADAISKIPSFGSDRAIEELRAKLLSMASEYIESAALAIREAGIRETVEPVVVMGHALSDYVRLVEEHRVDLLIMNTKDEGQQAMAGLAYALAVELRERPLLLL